jgi:uncharacterized membrane protein
MTSLSNIGWIPTKPRWKTRVRRRFRSKQTPRTLTNNAVASLKKRTSGAKTDIGRDAARDLARRAKGELARRSNGGGLARRAGRDLAHQAKSDLARIAASDLGRHLKRPSVGNLMHLRHRSNSSARTVPLLEIHTHASPLGGRRWITEIGSAAGAGVAAMYFLDPDRGPARRARVRDQAIHAQREAQHAIEKASRDVHNRASGVGAGVRYRIAGRKVGDPVLVERVRSRLGTVSGHARAIDVTVSDGAVRLCGDVLADEHDSVVRAVSKVPGVRSVDDQLRVHAYSEGVSALQGASRPRRRADMLQDAWSPATRLAAGAAGVCLVDTGRRLGGLAGLLLRGGGAAMAARAVTNRSLRQVTGVGAGRDAVETAAAVTINASPDEVWPVVSNYTSFPTFMSNVVTVEERGEDGVTRWTVRGPAHTDVTFDARETFRVEGRRIGWKTLPDQTIGHSGEIAVQPDDGRCQVQARMHYNPIAGGIGHGVASLFGVDAHHLMRADLVRLRDQIERRKRDGERAAAS